MGAGKKRVAESGPRVQVEIKRRFKQIESFGELIARRSPPGKLRNEEVGTGRGRLHETPIGSAERSQFCIERRTLCQLENWFRNFVLS